MNYEIHIITGTHIGTQKKAGSNNQPFKIWVFHEQHKNL